MSAEQSKKHRPRRLLKTYDAADLLDVSPATLANARVSGRTDYPPFVKIGGSVRYELAEIEAFIKRQRRSSTSDMGGRSDVA